MTIEISTEPEWLGELAVEHTHILRQQIVQTVRQYCITANRPYRDVWHKVYERFELDTGLKLAKTKRNKLDFVQAHDRLGDLLRAVTAITAQAG